MLLVFRSPMSHAADAHETSAMASMSGCVSIFANWYYLRAAIAAFAVGRDTSYSAATSVSPSPDPGSIRPSSTLDRNEAVRASTTETVRNPFIDLPPGARHGCVRAGIYRLVRLSVRLSGIFIDTHVYL